MHLKIIVLLLLFLIASNCAENQGNFFVFNKDTEAIDSLFIFVGNETYLIEDLQPKTTKGIRIYKMGGKQISLQADDEKPLPLSSVAHSPFRGTQRLIITKKRIVSSSTFSD